jgi:hypothetical protein
MTRSSSRTNSDCYKAGYCSVFLAGPHAACVSAIRIYHFSEGILRTNCPRDPIHQDCHVSQRSKPGTTHCRQLHLRMARNAGNPGDPLDHFRRMGRCSIDPIVRCGNHPSARTCECGPISDIHSLDFIDSAFREISSLSPITGSHADIVRPSPFHLGTTCI